MNSTTLNDFEIMAPVGSRESLAAAIQAGADSIYFGIENLNMRRIEADVCLWGVINFRTNYHGYRGGNHPTLFRNICIEDVTCNRVDSVALMANGLPEAKLHNITLRNINVKKAPKAIQMENVVNLTLDNVVVNGEKVTAP